MAFARQCGGRGQSRGAAADDRHVFTGAGRGRFERAVHAVRACQIDVRCETLEGGDGNWFVQLTPAALLLAGMRADAADGRGQRDLVHDHVQRLGAEAVRDEPHVPLAVGLGGARFHTGRAAIASVVRHQQLQRQFARLDRAGRVGVVFHARGAFIDLGGAGAQQFAAALRLDHAHAARAVRFDPGIVAQRGDLDAVPGGNFDYHLAGFGADGNIVDLEFYTHVVRLLSQRRTMASIRQVS